ncbi:hypothetical protein F4604DRAFT_872163 [Suillus subluteus]|nr:hypothetical protein F4604DRAFT_872163 [Suillus subluteus]
MQLVRETCDAAILSHRWLVEREATLKGVANGEAPDNELQFVSSGVCYIDKRSSDKSIHSMFLLYRSQARNDSGVVQATPVKCDASLIHQLQHTVSYAVPIHVPHRHLRVILDVIPVKLTQLKSFRQVVQVARDAVIAHQGAFTLCGVARLCISIGNIMLHGQKNILMDWDLVTSVEESESGRSIRIGTVPFVSANLLLDKNSLRNFQDDMESVLCLILWLALRICTRSCFPNDILGHSYSLWMQRSLIFHHSCSIMKFDTSTFKGHGALDCFVQELADVFASRYTVPKEEDYEVYNAHKDNESSIAHELLKGNAAAKKMSGLELLKSHAGVIQIFDKYLSDEARWLQV